MLSRLILNLITSPFFWLIGGLGVHETSTFVLIATTKKKREKKEKGVHPWPLLGGDS